MARGVPHGPAPARPGRADHPEAPDAAGRSCRPADGERSRGDSNPGLLVHLMLAAAEFGYLQWLRSPRDRGASLPVCVEGALDAVRDERWSVEPKRPHTRKERGQTS